MSPSAEEVGFAYLPLVPKLDRGFSRQVGNQLKGEFGTAGQQAGRRMGEQVVVGGRRSVAAGAKSFFGPLLAAGAAYKAVDFFGNAIEGASDLTESGTKLGEVFGKQAAKITQFSAGAASTLGQSDLAARNAAATFGVYGKAAGLANRENVKFSTDLASLAGDLASFYNTDVDQAIEAIGSGLRGESEPLRQYGVLLDDATLRAKALELGIISTTKNALTPQQRVLAAQSVILEQTKIAQGDFGRTSENLANQQRILAANFDNASAKLGRGLLPVATDFVQFLNRDGVPAVERFATWFAEDGQRNVERFGRFLSEDAAPAAKDLYETLRPLAQSVLPVAGQAFETTADALKVVAPLATDVLEAFGDLPESAQQALILAGGAKLLKSRMGGIGGENGVATVAASGLLSFGTSAEGAGNKSEKATGRIGALRGALRGGLGQVGLVAGVTGVLGAIDDLDHSLEDTKLLELNELLAGGFSANGQQTAAFGQKLRDSFDLAGIGEDAQKLGIDLDALARDLRDNGTDGEYFAEVMGKIQSTQESAFRGQTFPNPFGDSLFDRASRFEDALAGIAGEWDSARRSAKSYDDLIKTFTPEAAGRRPDNKPAKGTRVVNPQEFLAVKELQKLVSQVPGEVITKISTPGAVQSKRDVLDLRKQYNLTPDQIETIMRALDFATPQIDDVRGKAERLDKRKFDLYVRGKNIDKTRSQVERLGIDVGKALNAVPDEQVRINLSPSAARIAKVDRQLGGKLMATGGQVIGPGSGTSDDIPVWLSNGEHVLTAEEVKKAGGHKNIELVRKAMLRGDFAKVGDLGFGKFATGGAVTPNASMRGLNAAIMQIRRQNAAYSDEVGRYMSARISKALTETPPPGQLGPGGRMTATQALRGQQFARSQVGKPYGWAMSGPNAYDCSGFISAVTNASLGTSLYKRRGATGSMPWPQFSSGLGGLFDVGWFTGSPGHTAGTLNGLNVESYGGHGVSVTNRGATDGLFNRHMSMATGGPVFGPGTGTSDSIFARLSNGEHVWTAAEVKAVGGHGAVMAMRRFANGGPVTGSSGISFQDLVAALSRNTMAVSRAANVNASLTNANRRLSGFEGSQARLESAQNRVNDAVTNRASRLDLLNQQQSIRDLEKSLASKKKGERLKGLDRQIAKAELAEAKRELTRLQGTNAELVRARAALATAQRDRRRYGSEAQEQARVERAEQAVEAARQRLDDIADATNQFRSNAALSNVASLTPASVERFVAKQIVNLGQFTAVMAGLKQRGAAPWLLEQFQALGPAPAVIRLGKRYLADTKALASINTEVGRLGSVSNAYGSLVTDPRFLQTGGANLLTAAQTKQIQIIVQGSERDAVAIRRELRPVLVEVTNGGFVG